MDGALKQQRETSYMWRFWNTWPSAARRRAPLLTTIIIYTYVWIYECGFWFLPHGKVAGGRTEGRTDGERGVACLTHDGLQVAPSGIAFAIMCYFSRPGWEGDTRASRGLYQNYRGKGAKWLSEGLALFLHEVLVGG